MTYLDALTLTLQVLFKISSNFLHLPLAAFAAAVVLSFRK